MLKIEVIKFEAQDIITASTASTAVCSCTMDDFRDHHSWNEETWEWVDIGHSGCAASSHPNCVQPEE